MKPAVGEEAVQKFDRQIHCRGRQALGCQRRRFDGDLILCANRSDGLWTVCSLKGRHEKQYADDFGHSAIPRHIAVIMDGNGRWAKKRFLPRVMGHKRGLDALENMVKHCAELGVQYLTVFAFSTENWRRPEEEVSFLMGLFLQALQKQVRRLHDNNMRLKGVGQPRTF